MLSWKLEISFNQLNSYRHVMNLLNVEEDKCDVDALKTENKTLRREIFDLHDVVKELEDKLAEIREDSI